MRITRVYFLNMVLLGLFGWAMVAYYRATDEFKISITNSDDVFSFSMNITPLVLGLIIAGTAAVVVTRKQRKQGRGWKKVFLLPT